MISKLPHVYDRATFTASVGDLSIKKKKLAGQGKLYHNLPLSDQLTTEQQTEVFHVVGRRGSSDTGHWKRTKHGVSQQM